MSCLVAIYCVLLAVSTTAQHFAPPALSVLHNACITRLDGCNRPFNYDRVYKKKEEVIKMKDVKIRKVYSGVTAMLTANHGWLDRKFGQGDSVSSNKVMFDWSNYEHWAETCLLFHSLVNKYGEHINDSVRKYDLHKEVLNIALPQVLPALERQCGDNGLIPALYGEMILPREKKKHRKRSNLVHDVKPSEGFIAFARGATRSLQRVLSDSHSTSMERNNPNVLYCDDMRPSISAHRILEVVCFDTVVEMDPFTPHLIESTMERGWETSTHTYRQFQHDVRGLLTHNTTSLQKESVSLQSQAPEVRQVTLISRKFGPRWGNRDFVVEALQTAVNTANTYHSNTTAPRYVYKFMDAGHAEEFGLHNGCYSISAQVELWRNSWLVIAPHGAHETNVLFMQQHKGGGLIEAFACGHRQNWFELFAAISGVPYHAAQETDHEERRHCKGDGLGRTYLDRERNITFEHDSLLDVVYERLGVPPSIYAAIR